MVRSGWVSRRRRAGSPTMMLPSGSRLTTEGQSVEPDGPAIQFGSPVCGSMYATRLLVVPRSIPTVRAICNLQQLFRDVGHQISNIGASIQQLIQPDHDSLPVGAPFSGVECRFPLAGCLLDCSVHHAELLFTVLFRICKARHE